jgi:hypothetical protein
MKEGSTVSSNARLTGNRARVQRYRSLHRRIDYVPSPDVLPIHPALPEDWEGSLFGWRH